MKTAIRVYVEFEQDGMQVEKRKLVFLAYTPEQDLEKFLPVLRKELTNKNHKRHMVTIHLMNDLYERNDERTHRYIMNEIWHVGDTHTGGYEKRPYVHGYGFPEVPNTPADSPALAMFRAIEQELHKLVAAHAHPKTYYLWNARTEQDGAEMFASEEEAHKARRALPDEEADATYVRTR